MMSGLVVSRRRKHRWCSHRSAIRQEKSCWVDRPPANRAFQRTETIAWLTEIIRQCGAADRREQIDVGAGLIAENGSEAFVSRDVLTNGDGPSRWTSFG